MIKQMMNGAQFAELCGVSPDSVSRWCKNGMPHQGGGRSGISLEIDIRQALPWLTETRRPESSHELLARERADKFALENAETRKSLIKTEHVTATVNQMQKALEKRLQISEKLANEVAATSDPAAARTIIQDYIRRIREQYADDLQRCGS